MSRAKQDCRPETREIQISSIPSYFYHSSSSPPKRQPPSCRSGAMAHRAGEGPPHFFQRIALTGTILKI
jgi:hypothetical protein